MNLLNIRALAVTVLHGAEIKNVAILIYSLGKAQASDRIRYIARQIALLQLHIYCAILHKKHTDRCLRFRGLLACDLIFICFVDLNNAMSFHRICEPSVHQIFHEGDIIQHLEPLRAAGAPAAGHGGKRYHRKRHNRDHRQHNADLCQGRAFTFSFMHSRASFPR